MVRTNTGGSPKTRPITRSSIRQSIGRAFADVINKEGKDSDKATKKIKDTRRLSALNLKPTAPRDSMGEARPLPQPVKRTGTPDSVTLIRKRLSITVQRPVLDEQSSKSTEITPREGPVTRSAALRPSSRQNTISALPKYRPKSVASETAQQQPPSPPHVTTRRRLRTSEDEKEEKQNSKEPNTPQSSQKGVRPISPLPLRASRTSGLSTSTPPSTPLRHQPVTPSSAKSSPTLSSRPPKAVKTTTSSVASQANITREYSSSSSTSGTPRTPKLNITKATTRRTDRENVREKSSAASPSPKRSPSESPVAHRQLRVVDLTNDSPMSHISEATSEEEDVALLLAPVADPTAPTPAMPRLAKMRKQLPRTPTRPGNTLPSRAQMSYLSPPPPTETSPSRPRLKSKAGDDRMFRGSILSWEQLADEASKTLGEEEVHSMLADVPAPFASTQISPSASTNGMDIPDSPCLSVLNSPGAFGSISQVLLPDMTPSPAFHNNTRKYDDIGTVDGAIVTLLRLQLVAAENMAKERLSRLLTMEDEMHNLKQEHRRETSELSMQLSQMQDKLCEKEEYEERLAVERAAHTSSLEEKLRHAQGLQEKAVQDGIARYKERERLSRKAEQRHWHVVMGASCAASVARAGWGSVRELSEAELETVKSDRRLLSGVLAELDRMALLVV